MQPPAAKRVLAMRNGSHKEIRFRVATSALALSKSVNHGVPLSKRAQGATQIGQGPFLPPEDWYEPSEKPGDGYRVISQQPGCGYRHPVSEKEVRDRLAQLPDWMLRPLEVVQLSRMTRKKQTFPCYGMQWGTSLYLYPIEDSMVEDFARPPKPAIYNEVRMYGGRWNQVSSDHWQLIWSESSLRDFYLNNILIHELGHLLDNRNRSYTDRERYAEWFALEFGYRASERAGLAQRAARRTIRRRHHSK